MTNGDREQQEALRSLPASPGDAAGDDLPSPREQELFAYLDGELDDEAMARFEAKLASDPELRAMLRAQEAIAGFVRDDAARTYAASNVDAIAGEVMAKLEAARPPAPVIEIATAQTTRFQRSRAGSVVWVAFAGVAAVAAAIALFAGPRREPASAPTLASNAVTTSATASDKVATATPHPTSSRALDPVPPATNGGVEVEDLEVGEGATVIYTGSAAGAVVWVNGPH
jgi:anti-sigma factor RsiW